MDAKHYIHQMWIFVILSILIGATLGFVIGQAVSNAGVTGEAMQMKKVAVTSKLNCVVKSTTAMGLYTLDSVCSVDGRYGLVGLWETQVYSYADATCTTNPVIHNSKSKLVNGEVNNIFGHDCYKMGDSYFKRFDTIDVLCCK